MINENLIQYIKENLQNGYSVTDIQNVLINQGFPAQDVYDTINYVQQNNQNTENNLNIESTVQKKIIPKKIIYIVISIVSILIIGTLLFLFIDFSSNRISDEDLSRGTNVNVKENDQVFFNVNNLRQDLRVYTVDGNTVTFSLKNEEIIDNINVNEEKKYDLNDDGFYDIKLKLNNIMNNVPNFRIQKINEMRCIENWDCNDWSDCNQENTQSRTCIDLNECDSTKNKPRIVQDCRCVENWGCSNWSICNEEGYQNRTCVDLNDCQTDNTPNLTQECEFVCIEDWICEDWSNCNEQGYQNRTCVDLNDCNTTESKPILIQSCDDDSINFKNIVLDLNIPKETYSVGEEIELEFHFKYEGEPFHGAIIYCVNNECSIDRGTIESIELNNVDETSMKQTLKETFDEEGIYNFSISIFNCEDIDNHFNTIECGGDWRMTISIEDIISQVQPLKSESKLVNVGENNLFKCMNNNDCTQTCTNCKSGTYVCLSSSDPEKDKTCVECVTKFSCLDGFICENNVCVEEEIDQTCTTQSFSILPGMVSFNIGNNVNVKVLNVDENEKFTVDVDGISGIIEKMEIKTINGVKIKNEGLDGNMAKLRIICDDLDDYPVKNPETILDCYNDDISEIICHPEKANEFGTIFETRLENCEISQGTFALGFEPVFGFFRGYQILGEEQGKCRVKFWFLDNVNIEPNFLNKEMICEYGSLRDIDEVNWCFEECCEGELFTELDKFTEEIQYSDEFILN